MDVATEMPPDLELKGAGRQNSGPGGGEYTDLEASLVPMAKRPRTFHRQNTEEALRSAAALGQPPSTCWTHTRSSF